MIQDPRITEENLIWKGKTLKADIFKSYDDMLFSVTVRLDLDGFVWRGDSYEGGTSYHSKDISSKIALSNLEKKIAYYASGDYVSVLDSELQEAIYAKNEAIEQQKISKSLQKMLNLGV